MSKFSKKMYNKYKKSKSSALLVYFILRSLVTLCAIGEFINGNVGNVVLCIISLILFTVPTFIEEKMQIELPNALELLVYIFIFSSEILGEINNFYGIIPYWDTMLHAINGFLCAGIGFSLVDILNKNSKRISLSPIYVALVAFCFSMTIGVCWEFIEYAADNYLDADMQKDRIVNKINSVKLNENNENVPVIINDISSTTIKTNDGNVIVIDNGYLDIGLIDTMKDLFVNFIGAIIFSVMGGIYIKNRDKNSFINNFIIRRG